jgi:hypothetical protein
VDYDPFYVLLAQSPAGVADVPEAGVLNVVTNTGAMGLLGLIVVLLFKYVPALASAHREGMQALTESQVETAREARVQLDRVAAEIKQDRHADRQLSHQQFLAFQTEAREQRDAFLRESSEQRKHDEAKTERLIAVINEQKNAMVDALRKIDESHRLLAAAIDRRNEESGVLRKGRDPNVHE